jgi:hypothetical protein
MASWKEIEELKRNAARACHMAKFLLTTPGLSTWEEGFLESMESHRGPLSTRQAEKLL